jgi:hypothetical protein
VKSAANAAALIVLVPSSDAAGRRAGDALAEGKRAPIPRLAMSECRSAGARAVEVSLVDWYSSRELG